MNEQSDQAKTPRDAANWARPVDRMEVGALPSEAINLNVQGRRPTGPLQGFGQMWQKTYRVRLPASAATPAQVVQTWKTRFPEFWPRGNRFYGPLTGVAPGEVAVLNVAGPGGMPMSTGIRVIYADDESFSVMTPHRHMFAGMITFSAYAEGETTVAQIQALLRASDPVYEIGFRLGFGHKLEDRFWRDTLGNLAGHFGATAAVEHKNVCVDKRMQWSEARNIWHNAAIRTTFYLPVHLTRRLLRRGAASRQAG